MGAEMIAKKFSTLTGSTEHPGDILNQAVDVVAYVRESILASMEADDATDGYSLKALGGMFYVLIRTQTMDFLKQSKHWKWKLMRQNPTPFATKIYRPMRG